MSRTRFVHQALGRRSDEVEFVDADDWYDSPSRTLGRYNAYCAAHDTHETHETDETDETHETVRPRRVRVIGEPVWSDRTAFEV
ncbi:hypothetical protein [Streptomyces sp. NPDC020747]|uniref:hypothetical protein n=1 Tax=Streptomyces sp. NPDC020747 TaxID=3365086 RepID=UPI0037B2BA16